MAVNVSVKETAGPEKSRVMWKAIFIVGLCVGSYALAGSIFLTWALFKNFFCVDCSPWDDKISIFYLLFAVGLALSGYFLYKMARKNEKIKELTKAVLKKAGLMDSPAGPDNEVESWLKEWGIEGIGMPDQPAPDSDMDRQKQLELYSKEVEEIKRQNRMMKAMMLDMRDMAKKNARQDSDTSGESSS